MARQSPAAELWTDLDHNLKFNKERIVIEKNGIGIEGKKGPWINLKQVDGAYVEEGLGIGKLVVKKKDGGEVELAYFTKEKMPNFKRLALALDEYKEKGSLDFILNEETSNEKGNRIGTIKWILRFVRPYRKSILIGVLLSVISTTLSLVPAYMLKILIDNVLLVSNPPLGLFEELTVVLVLAYGLSTLMNVMQSFVLGTVGQKIVNNLRAKVYEKALDFSSGMMDKMTSGRILTRLTTDAGNTQWLMAYGFQTILINTLTVIGIGVILFSMDWNLALFVLLPAPFVIYALVKYRKKSHKIYHKNWRRSADMINTLYDTIYSYSIVKSFAKEGFENQRIGKMLDRIYGSNKDIVKMNITYWQSISFLTSLSTVIIWWVGGNQVIGGNIQIGVITAFVAYMVMFYSPINQLSNIIPYVQQALTSGDRIREVIDKDIDIKNAKNAKKPKLNGNIQFNKVWFGYDPYVPVIADFSMMLKAGHNIAVVGRSGSGKSTISKLMLRFYESNKGSIMLSGMDIKNIELGYLRDRIAYVPQDVALFDNSVAYNIKYGANRVVTDSEIIASARAARVHEELMSLPFSYDTDLGERGWSLSGGQRQRLSIARAVIKKPDIVILDESTSNLDVESEQEIYSAILNLTKGKTTIFVTHNMNEVMHSDNVVVLKKGKIIEYGNPKTLFRKKGEFHKMFNRQMNNWNSKIADPAKGNESIGSYLNDAITDYESVRIDAGHRGSRVGAVVRGKHHLNLRPKLPFPITNVNFVILYNEEDKPELILDDYSKLDNKSRDALYTAVLLNTFKPTVSEVRKIEIKGDELEWTIVIDGNEMAITTKGRRNVVLYDNKIVLSDIRDSLYEINLDNLDKKSLRTVTETI